MERILTYQIKEPDAGKTIGEFLRERGYSQPIMVHLKKTKEGILLNGIWSYVNTQMSIHDVLTIRLIETENSKNIPPTPISKELFLSMIVYEDEDILIINKPAGLPVHPSLGHYEDTLANYCAYYYQSLIYPPQTGFVFRCVNRLDRDTSGLVLIAKNMLSAAGLSVQQQSKMIHRTYLAITIGITPLQGTITLPIARKDASIIERCIDEENGEPAITHYQRIATTCLDGQNYSLLQIQLETGKTHQIRVHMKAIGHPLPGDFLYYPDFSHIKRQALHSYRLDFTHPITGKALSFTQEMPSDFHAILS